MVSLETIEVYKVPQVFRHPFRFVEYFDNSVLLVGDSHVLTVNLNEPVPIPRVNPLPQAPIEIQQPKLSFWQKYVCINESIKKWESKTVSVDYGSLT